MPMSSWPRSRRREVVGEQVLEVEAPDERVALDAAVGDVAALDARALAVAQARRCRGGQACARRGADELLVDAVKRQEAASVLRQLRLDDDADDRADLRAAPPAAVGDRGDAGATCRRTGVDGTVTGGTDAGDRHLPRRRGKAATVAKKATVRWEGASSMHRVIGAPRARCAVLGALRLGDLREGLQLSLDGRTDVAVRPPPPGCGRGGTGAVPTAGARRRAWEPARAPRGRRGGAVRRRAARRPGRGPSCRRGWWCEGQ